jgi:hypothetical protein
MKCEATTRNRQHESHAVNDYAPGGYGNYDERLESTIHTRYAVPRPFTGGDAAVLQ